MKVFERALENKIRREVSIDHSFMLWKGITYAIFIIQETPSKEEIILCLCGFEESFLQSLEGGGDMDYGKLSEYEWFIHTFMASYTEACTVVRTDAGQSEFRSECWFA